MWVDRYREQAAAWRLIAGRYPEGSRRRLALLNAEVYEELVREAEGGALEAQPQGDRLA